MTHCVNVSSSDAHHPGTLEWEDGRAYCPKCMRLKRAMAARRHPASLPAMNLPPLDPRRCYHHDQPDKLACPECLFDVEVT